jgi:predicted small lipoprotein YifL
LRERRTHRRGAGELREAVDVLLTDEDARPFDTSIRTGQPISGEQRMNIRTLWLAPLACAMSLGLAACENKGPLEQAGEEIDEAVDTMKHGEESTSNKLDDAVDELRE